MSNRNIAVLVAAMLWLFLPLIFLLGLNFYDGYKKAKLDAVSTLSLQGVDTNQNHLRDDVEALIQALQWPPVQYQAATDYAVHLQNYMLLGSVNRNALLSASMKQTCASMQMHVAFPNGGTTNPYDAVTGVFNMVLNTENRKQAYLRNEILLDSFISKRLDITDCGIQKLGMA